MVGHPVLSYWAFVAEPAAEIGSLAYVISLVEGEEVDESADLAVEAGRLRRSGRGKHFLRGFFQLGSQGICHIVPGKQDFVMRGILGRAGRLCAAREERQPRP